MGQTLYALDPGSELTGWVHFDPETKAILACGKDRNDVVLDALHQLDPDDTVLVIERMKPRGMPTAAAEMRALEWFGAFAQAAGYTPATVEYVYRDDVKLHLCGRTSGANDSTVRRALLDRWGGDAAGRKGGPLAAVKGDAWAALAVAVTWCDKHLEDDQ